MSASGIQIEEQPASPASGALGMVAGVGLMLLGIALIVWGNHAHLSRAPVSVGAVLIAAGLLAHLGLVTVAPGQALVLQLFGRYAGSVRESGFYWISPLARRRRVSTKIRNHETPLAKVNDADGIPIEIAAVVVWQVEDTAKAVYAAEDFVQFVAVQTETAVRRIASGYRYDSHNRRDVSLRNHADEITEKLCAEMSARVAAAGVRVMEARITRLAYAPEIAQVMLQRQQAGAVIAARQQIVEGAVGMVEMALDRLAREDIVELDEERKAAMVTNLLVVLCGERGTQPIVNAGSLYH